MPTRRAAGATAVGSHGRGSRGEGSHRPYAAHVAQGAQQDGRHVGRQRLGRLAHAAAGSGSALRGCG
eukprot:3957185-Prymnesium_polylepis.1